MNGKRAKMLRAISAAHATTTEKPPLPIWFLVPAKGAPTKYERVGNYGENAPTFAYPPRHARSIYRRLKKALRRGI